MAPVAPAFSRLQAKPSLQPEAICLQHQLGSDYIHVSGLPTNQSGYQVHIVGETKTVVPLSADNKFKLPHQSVSQLLTLHFEQDGKLATNIPVIALPVYDIPTISVLHRLPYGCMMLQGSNFLQTEDLKVSLQIAPAQQAGPGQVSPTPKVAEMLATLPVGSIIPSKRALVVNSNMLIFQPESQVADLKQVQSVCFTFAPKTHVSVVVPARKGTNSCSKADKETQT
eukprot:TRINITY_DN8371_c0_g3_i1.p1 TRINITY_DN8371_c0_g3~~TRINITY_DN8371_c0_g3_i1.p1  ORF type:complete len:226 (-),score=37.39 TRINITY_DN8371_c0_g3_i1:155-832(-)